MARKECAEGGDDARIFEKNRLSPGRVHISVRSTGPAALACSPTVGPVAVSSFRTADADRQHAAGGKSLFTQERQAPAIRIEGKEMQIDGEFCHRRFSLFEAGNG